MKSYRCCEEANINTKLVWTTSTSTSTTIIENSNFNLFYKRKPNEIRKKNNHLLSSISDWTKTNREIVTCVCLYACDVRTTDTELRERIVTTATTDDGDDAKDKII